MGTPIEQGGTGLRYGGNGGEMHYEKKPRPGSGRREYKGGLVKGFPPDYPALCVLSLARASRERLIPATI